MTLARTLIFAGSHVAFLQECRDRGLNPRSKDVKYIAGSWSLRGLRLAANDVLVKGFGFWDRRDCQQLLDDIRMLEATRERV